MEFDTKLGKILAEKGVSIYWLSLATHIPYKTLHDLVRGKTKINKTSFENIYKISVVIEEEIDEIIDFENIAELKDYYRLKKLRHESCQGMNDRKGEL